MGVCKQCRRPIVPPPPIFGSSEVKKIKIRLFNGNHLSLEVFHSCFVKKTPLYASNAW
jgi:hypothetical protein